MFDLHIENDDIRKKHILVEISDTSYAFSINTVKEVIPMIEIFSITTSGEILGIINLRGESVPVIDIRNILGQENNKINAKQKLVILEINLSKLAVIVDSIIDIINIEEEHILNMPYGKNLVKTTIIDGKTVAIIDTYALFELYYSNSEHCMASQGELIPVEDKSAPVIKIRTEIINRTNDYMLPQEAFLNEKFIIFRLEKEIYAFNIMHVEEIKMISKNMISKVPCVPNFVKGIINYGGDYICLFDIKPFLNISEEEITEKNDVLIINVNNFRLAIKVDEIINVDTLQIQNIILPNKYENSFIKGEINQDGYTINLLDEEKLFSSSNVDLENYEIE